MEWLKAVEWDHPAVVAASGAAVGGIFLIAAALLKRKKQPDGGAPSISTTANPKFTSAPHIEIENKPSNVLKSIVKVGLDEKAVGQELSKAVDPLRQDVSSGFKALSEQMAAQLAPKQPVPVSGNPLKIKAIEFFNAGLDAYHKGEIGQAIGHWLDALQLDPDLADAHNAIGILMHAKGELDLAIEHYSAALRIEPDDALAHSNLGVSLRIIGDLDAAIEHCNAAIQINPRTALHHHNLARVLAQKKDAAAAVAALVKAIDLDPRYCEKAKQDSDFDPIRDDPAFHKLLDAD